MYLAKYANLLRQELELKNYSKSSIDLYVSVLYGFLKDFENSYSCPEKIPVESIKQWLKESPSMSTLRIRIGALKNFYKRVVRQPLKFKYIEYPKKERKYPIILSQQEIQQLLDSAKSNPKHYAIICVLYSTGVRVSELLNIRFKDIDRANGVIHITNGKGGKQRQVKLDEKVLDVISKYYLWNKVKPKEFLFEGQFGGQYTASSINQFLKMYAKQAGINKRIYAHLVRHCTGTHLTEAGVSLGLIQRSFGHSSPKTTMIYQHISPNLISQMYSPIQALTISK